jgi:hypothetical protein
MMSQQLHETLVQDRKQSLQDAARISNRRRETRAQGVVRARVSPAFANPFPRRRSTPAVPSLVMPQR